jgi:radical SAM protein with 4Fe4S-binding SPASM domain
VKLSAPLRVCWDWNWPPVVMEEPAAPRIEGRETVAAALARSRVLMLEIGYPSPSDITGGSLAAAVKQIAAATAIVLSVREARELDDESRRLLSGLGEVWIDGTEDPGDGGDNSSWERPPGIRIYLTGDTVEGAVAALEAAVEGGVRKISLPILPLFGKFLKSPENQLPSWKDLMTFADRLEPLLRRHGDVDLQVHYQALWSIFRERGIVARGDEAPGHSGCQAASALGYIDPAGILYPCASLPIPLAGPSEDALAKAWRSDEAAGIRRAVGGMPPLCEDCDDLAACRGGCRGWAHYLAGTWSEPGPDCGRSGNPGGQQ